MSNNKLTDLRSNSFAYRIKQLPLEWPMSQQGFVVAGVGVDGDDDLYVSVRETPQAVYVFDSEGHYKTAFGGGLFKMVHGFGFTKENTVLVADGGATHTVREFTKEGELLRTFGTEGIPSDTGYTKGVASIKRLGGPFNKPTQMIQGNDGCYYASDGYRNAAVHKFDCNGNYLKSWGGPGFEEGKFMLPHGIHMDKLGRLWVADRENSRIQVFDSDGCLLKVLPQPDRPSEVWSTEDYIVVGEINSGFVIYDYAYQLLASFVFLYPPFTVHSICGDSKGNLYVATLGNYLNGVIKLERIENEN